MKLRWDPCVVQDAADFDLFLSEYIDQPGRNCLVIGGAGFDPRATLVPTRFGQMTHAAVEGLFFREERTLDQPLLRPCADSTEVSIRNLIPNATFKRIEIFSDGLTAVGGRRAAERMRALDLSRFTDVFVDISALSGGVFFPTVSLLIKRLDCAGAERPNLHLLVAEEPKFDQRIRGVPADSAAMLHGYKGASSLDGSETKALLWVPILSTGQRDTLGKIYQFIQRTDTPIDVCPIVPFPGIDPRLPERLIEEYRDHLTTWRADHRSLVYAAESDPLDSYRAISALCAGRDDLFAELGGSQVVLSPLGNKMLSVGAMLAAIERDLPVAMVESVGYDEAFDTAMPPTEGTLRHVWLCGAAYAE